MFAFFHIFSVILGLAAVILPISALLKGSADPRFSLGSLSACAIALVCQIGAYTDRIDLQDWAALLDTYGFTSKLASCMMLAVILLNIILYHVNSKPKK